MRKSRRGMDRGDGSPLVEMMMGLLLLMMMQPFLLFPTASSSFDTDIHTYIHTYIHTHIDTYTHT